MVGWTSKERAGFELRMTRLVDYTIIDGGLRADNGLLDVVKSSKRVD